MWTVPCFPQVVHIMINKQDHTQIYRLQDDDLTVTDKDGNVKTLSADELEANVAKNIDEDGMFTLITHFIHTQWYIYFDYK